MKAITPTSQRLAVTSSKENKVRPLEETASYRPKIKFKSLGDLLAVVDFDYKHWQQAETFVYNWVCQNEILPGFFGSRPTDKHSHHDFAINKHSNNPVRPGRVVKCEIKSSAHDAFFFYLSREQAKIVNRGGILYILRRAGRQQGKYEIRKLMNGDLQTTLRAHFPNLSPMNQQQLSPVVRSSPRFKDRNRKRKFKP